MWKTITSALDLPQGEYIIVRPKGQRFGGKKYTPSVVTVDGNLCMYDANSVRVRLEHHKQGLEWMRIPD